MDYTQYILKDGAVVVLGERADLDKLFGAFCLCDLLAWPKKINVDFDQ